MRGSWTRPPEIQVRFVRSAVYDDPAVEENARALLDEGERRAVDRILREPARRDALAAHVLARTMLSRIAGCAPARLRFRASARGRPEVTRPAAARPLRFSLSHADGIALCAVAAGGDVGADVESLRNIGPDPVGLAATVCSRREQAALRALPPSGRAGHLLALWTMKEAVVKLIGDGVRKPLDQVEVCEGSPWNVTVRRLSPIHLAAVAVARGGRYGAMAVRCDEVLGAA